MATSQKNVKYKSLNEIPAIFKVKTMAEIMGINVVKAYEIVKRQDFHASIKIGQRIMIVKEHFRDWLKKAALCEQFKNGYKELSKKEQKIYDTAFWEAVTFLKKQEADSNGRSKKIEPIHQ